MRWGGKAWGVYLGWALGGPLGGIVGTLVGHTIDKRQQNKDKVAFQFTLLSILASVAKADGEATENEIKLILYTFHQAGFKEEDLTYITAALYEALKQDIDIKILCENYKAWSSHETRLFLFRIVYMVAIADSVIATKEKELIEKIRVFLDISTEEAKAIKAEFVPSASKYYEILGISEESSYEEAQKAYRRKIMQYHPDRLGHLGEEYVRIATERFQEIQEAFREIEPEVKNRIPKKTYSAYTEASSLKKESSKIDNSGKFLFVCIVKDMNGIKKRVHSYADNETDLTYYLKSKSYDLVSTEKRLPKPSKSCRFCSSKYTTNLGRKIDDPAIWVLIIFTLGLSLGAVSPTYECDICHKRFE